MDYNENQPVRYKGVTFLAFVIMFVLVSVCSSCHRGPYFRTQRKGGIEKYYYNKRVWPADATCAAYSSTQPIKTSTVRRQQYHRYYRGQ